MPVHTNLHETLDELLQERSSPPAATTPVDGSQAVPSEPSVTDKDWAAPPANSVRVGHLERLKAMIQCQRPLDVHPIDREKDPAWVREVVALLGDIAGYARMFRVDKRDGHERSIDEVRGLVATLCRQRGIEAVFEMVMGWRGFSPARLPKEVLATWSRLFELPEGFFEPHSAR